MRHILSCLLVTVLSRDCPAAQHPECDYGKDNVSWGEYQTSIPVPCAHEKCAIELTFDTETTIGSCHSGCEGGRPSCTGHVCHVIYTGSLLQMFNIKNTEAVAEDDW